MSYEYVAENLARVKEGIEAAKRRVGRADDVSLLAVTKSATDEEVLKLLQCGVGMIGENRALLFSHRVELARENGYSPEAHVIGTLQTNKVRTVIDRVSCIQSLDSEALAREIEKQAAKRQINVRVLIEVNSGREKNKGGVMPEDTEAFYETVKKYPHLDVVGLMTMGPNCEDPEEYRPYFRETRALFDKIAAGGGFGKHPILSMGMSGSYEIAVEEGATMVRVGSNLFKK